MDQGQVEAKIRQCVDRVRSEGVEIVSRSFGVENKGGTWKAWDYGAGRKCCPMAAVILATNDHHPSDVPGIAARELLGVSQLWFSGFLGGFDGDEVMTGVRPHEEMAGYELGKKLRGEYVSADAE